jgi:hypothetical protein
VTAVVVPAHNEADRIRPGVGNPTKITRHPLDWALEMIRVAFSSLVHLPSLVRYMVDGTSRHS